MKNENRSGMWDGLSGYHDMWDKLGKVNSPWKSQKFGEGTVIVGKLVEKIVKQLKKK